MKQKLHTKVENVLNPFNRNHVAELSALTKERGICCAECKSKNVEFMQLSPDLGTLYFCSKKHFKKFERKNIYRALSLKKIK
jgi:hypothetical protein